MKINIEFFHFPLFPCAFPTLKHIDDNNKTAKQQECAKCKTQLHLQARIKLKDSKALHQLPAFAALTNAEVDTIIDVMDHIVQYKGAPICHQHDVSDSFYIIVKGAAFVQVNDENKVTGEIVMDDTGL